MLKLTPPPLAALASAVLIGTFVAAGLPRAESRPSPNADLINGRDFPDATGAFRTVSTTGSVDLHNPFFQSLGTNGRACVTCHQPLVDWTITPASVQAVFVLTGGRDPLFRTNDGSNSPDADVSTVSARRRAYSMLLSKAVIRIGLPIPAGAEFTLVKADDPYGHANAADLSLFRRPLPSTNLGFLSTVMWDGRENSPGRSIPNDLISQAGDAITGHAQATGIPTDDVLQSILDFESALYTTQSLDQDAGWLDQAGGGGGPENLTQQEFYIGINDPLGQNPKGFPFDSSAFTLYQNWANADAHQPGPGFGPGGRSAAQARAAVARGEQIFNTKPIPISGVGGLNDVVGSPLIQGTCTTCHDTPNVGNHSVAAPLNIGLTDASRRTPDMPLYTLRNIITGATVQTTDPGRALVSGKWADIGKFKGPILRGVAARAPFFHNGSAATLDDVVTFYDTRFGIGLTAQEKQDLAAFLRTL